MQNFCFCFLSCGGKWPCIFFMESWSDKSRNPNTFNMSTISNKNCETFCSGNVCKSVRIKGDNASFAYLNDILETKKFVILNVISQVGLYADIYLVHFHLQCLALNIEPSCAMFWHVFPWISQKLSAPNMHHINSSLKQFRSRASELHLTFLIYSVCSCSSEKMSREHEHLDIFSLGLSNSFCRSFTITQV